MAAYFQGKKDLFEGLAMASLEKEWKAYPVLRLDLSGKSYDAPNVLLDVFDDSLCKWEKQYGSEKRSDVPGLRFGNVIEAAFAKTGLPVVILIDEYDKPIIDNLGNDALADVFRSQLQGFYSVMKSKDGFIRFGFLTGVSKIGKLSVFSGLNNLVDISMEAPYADICGISENELRAYFQDSVRELADANELSEEECYQQLATWYDGYHFHPAADGVYNPFSLLNTFRALEFNNYWYETGTPSFLVRYLKQGGYNLEGISQNKVPVSVLKGLNSERPGVITLLYQTGYLTIKEYDAKTRLYGLGYPNKEVEDSFTESLSNFSTQTHRLENWKVNQ